MNIEVIADPPVDILLMSRYGGRAFAWSRRCHGERTILVYAHARIDGASHRSANAGLRALETFLADTQSVDQARVAILGFHRTDAYGELGYLLDGDNYYRLPDLPAADGDSFARVYAEVRRQAIRRDRRRQFLKLEHALAGLLPEPALIPAMVLERLEDCRGRIGRPGIVEDLEGRILAARPEALRRVLGECLRHVRRELE